jgi:hypothetical protein
MSTVDTDVALLKREAEQNIYSFSKLDNAIEKITDLGNDITKMLALHAQRLDRLEKIDQDIHGLVEKRRIELQTDIKYLDSKLASTIKEVSETFAETESRIMSALKEFKSEIKAEIKGDFESKSGAEKELVERVASLEKWRWLMVGGGVVVGAIITKLVPLLHLGIG